MYTQLAFVETSPQYDNQKFLVSCSVVKGGLVTFVHHWQLRASIKILRVGFTFI
jgi:hypothetical protein